MLARDREDELPENQAEAPPSAGPFRDAARDQARDREALDRDASPASEARAAAGAKPYTTEHEVYAPSALPRPDDPEQRRVARSGTPVDPDAITTETPPDPATEGRPHPAGEGRRDGN